MLTYVYYEGNKKLEYAFSLMPRFVVSLEFEPLTNLLLPHHQALTLVAIDLFGEQLKFPKITV